MAGKRKERFWRGLILTRSHARKVIDLTAGWFLFLAALAALAAILPRVDASRMLAALLFGIPAWFLQSKKSLIAARILFGLCAFAGLIPLLVVGIGIASSDYGAVAPMVIVSLFWIVPAIATWRACKAAKVLRDLPPDEPVIAPLDGLERSA